MHNNPPFCVHGWLFSPPLLLPFSLSPPRFYRAVAAVSSENTTSRKVTRSAYFPPK